MVASELHSSGSIIGQFGNQTVGENDDVYLSFAGRADQESNLWRSPDVPELLIFEDCLIGESKRASRPTPTRIYHETVAFPWLNLLR